MLYFVIAVSIIVISINAILKRKLHIEEDPVPLRPYSNTHKWIQRILLIGFIFLLAALYFVLNPANIYLLFGYVAIFLFYRTIMEYKYEREEKEYLLSFVSTLGALVLFVSSIFYGIQYMAPYKDAEQQIKSLNPEMVQQIEIINYSWDKNAKDALKAMNYIGETIIDDNLLIAEIIATLSETELRTRDVKEVNLDNYYRLYINSDQNLEITIYENYLKVNTGELTWFNVKGANIIFQMLNEGEKIEWQDPEV